MPRDVVAQDNFLQFNLVLSGGEEEERTNFEACVGVLPFSSWLSDRLLNGPGIAYIYWLCRVFARRRIGQMVCVLFIVCFTIVVINVLPYMDIHWPTMSVYLFQIL